MVRCAGSEWFSEERKVREVLALEVQITERLDSMTGDAFQVPVQPLRSAQVPSRNKIVVHGPTTLSPLYVAVAGAERRPQYPVDRRTCCCFDVYERE